MAAAEVFRDEILKALVVELRKGHELHREQLELNRQQLDVMCDLRDELVALRAEVRAFRGERDRDQREATEAVPVAIGG